MTTCLELRLPAVAASVRALRNEVAELAAGLGADDDVVDDVRLCVSEAVTNVVRHAYSSPEGTVDVRADVVGTKLVVAVRDEGVGLAVPRTPSPKGHGLQVIRQLTRATIASAPHEGTEVTMAFPLTTRAR